LYRFLIELYRNCKFMKKVFHFIFITLLIFAIGFWGEAVELSGSCSSAQTTEACEVSEKDEKEENNSYFDTFEKTVHSGQGGSGLKNTPSVFSVIESIEILFSQFLVVNQQYSSNSLSLKSYNDQLIQTIFIPKFYILYHCSKIFLS
jgi:hypothetical protein